MTATTNHPNSFMRVFFTIFLLKVRWSDLSFYYVGTTREGDQVMDPIEIPMSLPF